MSTLLLFPGIQRTSPYFRWALVEMGRRLNINPDYISGVMSLESGYIPSKTNTLSGATGLIQFMPKTAVRLGTTTGALRVMTAEGQLQYVEKFYRPQAARIQSPGDAYMATFMPAFVGYNGSFILGERDSREVLYGITKGAIYEQNKGLDRDNDGSVTIGDVTEIAERRYRSAQTAGTIDVPDEEPLSPKASPAEGG